MTEKHLVLVWEHGLGSEERIRADLEDTFVKVERREVTWREPLRSMSRFYERLFSKDAHKVEHCGLGPFVVYIVEDEEPVYEERETTSGRRLVNVNIFDRKGLYRQWTGGHRVHASDTAFEAGRDLWLLFGNGDDLVGAHGFTSLEEMLQTLNYTCKYVVLRNFEKLPKEVGHGDLDLLVEDYRKAAWMLNFQPLFEPPRVCGMVDVGYPLQVDLRYVGDHYYCDEWEQAILRGRVMDQGFYRPRDEDWFYTLAYHSVVQKPCVQVSQREVLRKLAPKVLLKKDQGRPIEEVLESWMEKKGYDVIRPSDPSVFFQKQDRIELPMMFPGKVIYENQIGRIEEGRVYSRIYEVGERIVKQSYGNISLWEKRILERFNSEYFPKVYDGGRVDDWAWVEMEKLDRMPPLSVGHLLNILRVLKEYGVSHRDIRPENILGRGWIPVLIDFQWATAPGLEIEAPPQLNPKFGCTPPDDVYSMGKVIEFLCGDKEVVRVMTEERRIPDEL